MTGTTGLPLSRFHQLIADAPLVSIDLVVVDSRERLLLGLRRNAPARDSWFVPGGRIRKGELLPDAMRRLLVTELGEGACALVPQWLGLYE
ncbi:MAG: NUDIX domain-containing protein, partial [Perlucidibaca sp.]